ncbi:hypothetical protein LF41_1055 [Lysobacter dokdonensis DS-58]|uniref:DUF4124 domain-containing protein n=1 Tax=Lysobacter dokdonensis DS-58 TaxID=1300345 RepID=A0A0A2WL42_9GAMM|nr:DUF4124 domain-containing protein [Lysobacter dokdonensis]KGQ20518.1 hypothetical protein LF41_1055 [Lysobacter dokdonensis DS-58]
MTIRSLSASAAVVLLLASGAAFAEEGRAASRVYKCIDASGSVSYQGTACANGATLVATHAYVLPVEVERRRELERQTAAREYNATYDRAYAQYSGQQASARDLQRTRCADARAHREATLAEVGLGRDFDLLRSLDDAVHAVCKRL